MTRMSNTRGTAFSGSQVALSTVYTFRSLFELVGSQEEINALLQGEPVFSKTYELSPPGDTKRLHVRIQLALPLVTLDVKSITYSGVLKTQSQSETVLAIVRVFSQHSCCIYTSKVTSMNFESVISDASTSKVSLMLHLDSKLPWRSYESIFQRRIADVGYCRTQLVQSAGLVPV